VTYTLELVDIESVRLHEEHVPETARRLAKKIHGDGVVHEAVLVESKHHVLLDGHHRLEALRALGCRKVPAYVVDYDDPDIHLSTWPGAVPVSVTKADVVAKALSGTKYPPKTTRHRLREPLPKISVPLAELM
jgi:hypothetical protein